MINIEKYVEAIGGRLILQTTGGPDPMSSGNQWRAQIDDFSLVDTHGSTLPTEGRGCSPHAAIDDLVSKIAGRLVIMNIGEENELKLSVPNSLKGLEDYT